MSEVVSIIVPTLNRKSLLEETLDSVSAQTYPHWEAIVVDDGSSDDTVAYMEDLSTKDARIRFFLRTGEHGNASVCRNQGLAAATGEYAVFLDSDDILATGFLEHRVATMQRNQDLDYAVWPACLFYETPGDCEEIFTVDNRDHPLDRFLRLDTPWQTSAVMWRKATLDALGPWKEELPSWQDWEIHVRALASGMRYLWFQEPDYFFRVPRPGSPRTSIGGKQYNDPEHMETAEVLLEHVQSILLQGGALSVSRRAALGGIYFVLAERWRKLGFKEKSRTVWARALERELISKRSLYVGRFFLAASQHRCKFTHIRWKWLWSRHLLNRGFGG